MSDNAGATNRRGYEIRPLFLIPLLVFLGLLVAIYIDHRQTSDAQNATRQEAAVHLKPNSGVQLAIQVNGRELEASPFGPIRPYGASITWDFGDGSSTQSRGSESVSHVYSKAGRYLVRATISAQQETITVERVASLYKATQLVSNEEFTCASLASQSVPVRCWPNQGDSRNPANLPQAIKGLRGSVKQLAAGKRHICALTDQGIYCWGNNEFGQLARTDVMQSDAAKPVPNLTAPAIAVAAGGDHSCALLQGGKIACWGDNTSGQSHASLDATLVSPKEFSGLPDTATQVAASTFHSCALTSTHKIYCWGANGGGRLGDGSERDSRTPAAVKLPDALKPVRLALGETYSCALIDDGSAWCWGEVPRAEGRRISPEPEPLKLDAEHLQSLVTLSNNVCWLSPGRLARCLNGSEPFGDKPLQSFTLTSGSDDGWQGCAITAPTDGDGGDVRCIGQAMEQPPLAITPVSIVQDVYLGDDDTVYSLEDHRPVQGAFGRVRQLIGAPGFYCALSRGGAMQCWGEHIDRYFNSSVGHYWTMPLPQRATRIFLKNEQPCGQLSADKAVCFDLNSSHRASSTGTLTPSPRTLIVLYQTIINRYLSPPSWEPLAYTLVVLYLLPPFLYWRRSKRFMPDLGRLNILRGFLADPAVRNDPAALVNKFHDLFGFWLDADIIELLGPRNDSGRVLARYRMAKPILVVTASAPALVLALHRNYASPLKCWLARLVFVALYLTTAIVAATVLTLDVEGLSQRASNLHSMAGICGFYLFVKSLDAMITLEAGIGLIKRLSRP